MASPINLYSIGQLSELCNIPIKTLRFYGQEGLLQPEKRDVQNNYRYYSEKQLLQILIIKELKFLGFSLEDIKNFLRKKDLSIFQTKIEEKAQEIEAHIQSLKIRLQVAMDNYHRIY